MFRELPKAVDISGKQFCALSGAIMRTFRCNFAHFQVKYCAPDNRWFQSSILENISAAAFLSFISFYRIYSSFPSSPAFIALPHLPCRTTAHQTDRYLESCSYVHARNNRLGRYPPSIFCSVIFPLHAYISNQIFIPFYHNITIKIYKRQELKT